MTNFSEKLVRTVSLFFILIALLLSYFNSMYYSPLVLLGIMIYFSTKGVEMFEDKIYFSTRLIFVLVFIALIFLKLYLVKRTSVGEINLQRFLLTSGLISFTVGALLGDFFAKYVYIRIKFFLNRLSASSNKQVYKIVKMENTEKKYMKNPGKKMGIYFYHITLEVNGENRKFLLEKELFEKIKNRNEILINIKKGWLGMYYGINMEE